jgi:ketopantoate reductase
LTQVKVSTLQDLERGRHTEADQTIGYVVRLARDLRVGLPTVELLYRVIQGIERGQRASASSA